MSVLTVANISRSAGSTSFIRKHSGSCGPLGNFFSGEIGYLQWHNGLYCGSMISGVDLQVSTKAGDSLLHSPNSHTTTGSGFQLPLTIEWDASSRVRHFQIYLILPNFQTDEGF